jgi:hypothetical protein
MPLRNVNLGDYSAENDRQLCEYFISDTVACKSARDLEDPRYILVGRTGAGKSAILQDIEHNFGDNKNYIVAFIKPNDKQLFLDLVIQSEEFHGVKSMPQDVLFKVIWHYVIVAAVLRERYSDGFSRKDFLSGPNLKAYTFLKKANELAEEEKTATDVFIGMLKEVGAKLGAFNIKFEISEKQAKNKIVNTLLRESQVFTRDDLYSVIGGKKVYILFDDLDKGWNPDDENQQMLIRGLFDALTDYAYKERVKPLVALRTNILDSLKLHQTEKFEGRLLKLIAISRFMSNSSKSE